MTKYDIEDPPRNSESLVLNVSLYGAVTFRVNIDYSEDRSTVDTRIEPVGQAVTSGMSQVVFDDAVFGSPQYLQRAVHADDVVQQVITDALKQLAAKLGAMRDPQPNSERLTGLPPGPDDTVN